MSEQDQRIMGNIGKTLPAMNENEKERLLSFTEGMAAMAQMRQGQEAQDEVSR